MCCVAFYAKKRSRRVVSWMFFPKRRIPKKLLKTIRSRNEKVKSFSTQTFIVSRCLLRQEKESSCRVAFYAKKRSHHVVSWIFFPKRRIPKKLLKPLEAGMRKLSHPQLKLLSCRVRMFFPKKKNVQVVSVTIRNRDEMYSQPNPYPNNSGTDAVRCSRKPRSRFLQRSAHPR